ncbi:pyrroloquinoline quinone precursor peptide PqqA [Flexivirga endophytica]|nr:pyrroloquinoline quinone precursor peptide PqqA [Flexivirga endophytica]
MERQTETRTMWEAPAITEIRVSAEVTAYVATSDK